MKLTKYQHACITLEKNDEALVVDPGDITDDFVTPSNVVGVVLTHEHPDHIDPVKISDILKKNPEAVVISHTGIIEQSNWPNMKAVAPGETLSVGGFDLEFFGGKHALIHSSIPIVDNIGVMVDSTLYYPGDSYAIPQKPVKVLAVPTSGPWLKIGDVADFVLAVQPEIAFSTHDAHSSEKNEELIDRLLPMLIQNSPTKYMRLTAPIDVET